MLLTRMAVSNGNDHDEQVGRTLRKEDQEPLFCGATPPPSSLVEPELTVLRDGDMVGHGR